MELFNLNTMMKGLIREIPLSIILIIVFTFHSFILQSQTILNTERMMKDVDSILNVSVNLEGDFIFGNVKLLQFNSSLLAGKKIKSNFIRAIFSYDYLAENKSIINSDYSGQVRYNYLISSNSVFGFMQAQNARALRMNQRFLFGGGYRQSVIPFSEKKNFLDVSLGIFYEYELYDKNLSNETKVNNMRISLTSFSQFKLFSKFRFSNNLYFQLNSKSSKDFRLFTDSRVYYDMKLFSFYLTYKNRYHNTPYIDIKRADSELIIGLEFNLKSKSQII